MYIKTEQNTVNDNRLHNQKYGSRIFIVGDEIV